MVLLPWITASFGLAIIIYFVFFHSLYRKRNRSSLTEKSVPEAGGGWPLFGHLFMLSGPDLLHISLSKMAEKHGPIFSIRVGPRRALVVNTWEAAKECYKTNDATFSTRPRTAAIAHMGYNFAMFGFSDYGPYWREMRKIVTQRLLSNRKVYALAPTIQAQIQAQIKSVNGYCSSCLAKEKAPIVNLSKVFGDLVITLMVGGVDTATVTLTWAMSYLLNNRHALMKAQEELDKHVGRERLVKESDIENQMYVQAVVKETLRIQPTIPITIREAGEDCIVAGYHIRAGTRLFVNTWKIQRDARIWDDPGKFKPERFLKRDGDGLGLEYGWAPFGGGRRGCPGVYLALRTTQLVLASILHGFDFETASGEEAVDMKESVGTANMKATPLEVCLNPRLSPQLYP